MRGRKKQQASAGAAASQQAKEKMPAQEKEVREAAGKEAAKEKQKRTGKEKVGGEAAMEPAMEQHKGKGKGKEKKQEEMEPAKEKEQQMGEGKQSDKEKAENVGKQFFKVFFPWQSREKLTIPPTFQKQLKEHPLGPVSLKGPSGNTWVAALAKGSQGLCFEQGWKEFAADHSLNSGYFLVFTHDGPSQFSVAVFSSLGVVETAALDAKPAIFKAIKVEADDEGIQGAQDAVEASEIPPVPAAEESGGTRKRTRAVRDIAAADANASKRQSSVAKKADKKTSEVGSTKGRAPTMRQRAMADLAADASATKRHSTAAKKAGKKRPEIGTSKDAPTIGKNKKDAPFSLLDESTTFNKTLIRDKDVPRSGEFLFSRSRSPIVISQRRPVTEAEKERTLKRAMEFKSKNPFSVQTMTESYVYVGFFMNIPCAFVRESLPRTTKKVTLWDPLGKSWEVKYVYYSDRCVGSFSGGWGKFALGNNLEKFDVCVFELFKEDNIRVHIYRVVPEITPLLRASKKD